MRKKVIDIGVVGCGYWGPNLVRNFRLLPNCNVKKICELDEKRLSHMKDLYPEVDTTTAYDDLISDADINAIAIATPVGLHYELAKESLKAGKHTMIEKPMAASVAECEEIIQVANENALKLMVGHTFIYSPPVRKIKEIVDARDLGELQYISARRLNLGLFQPDINVTWDLAPHDISIILYIMGEEPASVNCQGKAHVNPKIEDVTSLTLNFINGGFATLQSSWLDPIKIREMTLVGSKRMLLYNDIEPIEKIKIYDKRVETPPHYDTFAEFHYSYHHGDMYSPCLKQYEPLRLECEHFIDCIKTGEDPETGGYEGLKVVQILEAASESLRRQGAKVELAEIAERVETQQMDRESIQLETAQAV